MRSQAWFTHIDLKQTRVERSPSRTGYSWVEFWIVRARCACCNACWALHDGNEVRPNCIHGGPYNGYVEVP